MIDRFCSARLIRADRSAQVGKQCSAEIQDMRHCSDFHGLVFVMVFRLGIP